MTRWIVCLPLMMAACAPAAGPAAPSGAPRVETLSVENEIRGLRLTNEGMVAPATVPMSRAAAWSRVRTAFDSLGLVVGSEDEAAGVVSTGNFTMKGRLNGMRLSRVLSCGTQNGLDNADTYELVMNVSTRVIAAGDTESRLATSVQGWAQPRGIGGSNRLTCSTTGQLEARLAQLVLRS